MSAPLDYNSLGFKDIIVRLDGPVATATMNRAAQRNTYTERVCNELTDAFGYFDRDDRVRVVILTAEPTAPAFCSGADIGDGWDSLWNPEMEKELDPVGAHRDSGGKCTLSIFRCRKLTIAAVNGHAAGIGMTMQLPFDFRFVWAGAKLVFPFVARGIAAEAISSYLLPRLVGHSRANSLLLTGEPYPPSSPYMSPLYHEIIPTREEVYPAALKFAHRLALTTSATAVATTKALLWRGASSPEEQHILESKAIRFLGQSKDGEEGVKAFFEKRMPKFTATLSKDMPAWIPWWNEVNTVYRKAKL